NLGNPGQRIWSAVDHEVAYGEPSEPGRYGESCERSTLWSDPSLKGRLATWKKSQRSRRANRSPGPAVAGQSLASRLNLSGQLACFSRPSRGLSPYFSQRASLI